MSMPVPKASEHTSITHLRQAWEKKEFVMLVFFWGSSKGSSDTAATLSCFVAFTTKRWHSAAAANTAAVSRFGCPSIHTSMPTPLADSHTDFQSTGMGYWCVMHSTWSREYGRDEEGLMELSPGEYHLLGLALQAGTAVYSPYYKSRIGWLFQLQDDPLHCYRKCLCIFCAGSQKEGMCMAEEKDHGRFPLCRSALPKAWAHVHVPRVTAKNCMSEAETFILDMHPDPGLNTALLSLLCKLISISECVEA